MFMGVATVGEASVAHLFSRLYFCVAKLEFPEEVDTGDDSLGGVVICLR